MLTKYLDTRRELLQTGVSTLPQLSTASCQLYFSQRGAAEGFIVRGDKRAETVSK